MNWKQILGAVAIVLGVVCLFLSHSIAVQVGEGQEQINRGQSQVNQGKKFFSGNQVTKEVGNQLLFNPAEKKIREGQAEVDYYTTVAQQLNVGGIILILGGAGAIYFFRRKGS